MSSRTFPLTPAPTSIATPQTVSMDLSTYEEPLPELTIPLPLSRTPSDQGLEDGEAEGVENVAYNIPFQELAQAAGTQTTLEEDDSRPSDSPKPASSAGDYPNKGLVSDPSATGQEDTGQQSYGANEGNVPLDIAALLDSLQDERYEKQETENLQRSLYDLISGIGRSRRSSRILQRRQRSMAHAFRTQDQSKFTEEFVACETHLAQPSIPNIKDQTVGSNPDGNINLLDCLSRQHQSALLGFFERMRRDPTVLLTRLEDLSSQELAAWPLEVSTNSEDSVLASHKSNWRGFVTGTSRPVDEKSVSESFMNDDNVYHTTLHSLFDESCQKERALQRRLWTSVCVDLISKGKGGSEEFLLRVLDSFATLDNWTLRPRFEAFLLEVLQDGAFLLEAQPSALTGFNQAVDIQNATQATASSEFFDSSIRKLFEVLRASSQTYGIPKSSLDLARNVMNGLLEPKIRSRTKILVASRWFLSSFIYRAIAYPESVGLLLDHHVGEAPRLTILKRLATRLQHQVADASASWKCHMTVSPDVTAHVGNVMDVFAHESVDESLKGQADDPSPRPGLRFFHLGHTEVIRLISFLLPETRFAPMAQDNAPGNASVVQSLTDGSTVASESTEGPSLTPSSLAPSTSGTSLTSLVMKSEGTQMEAEFSPTAYVGQINKVPLSGAPVPVGEYFGPQILEASHKLQAAVSRQTPTPAQGKPIQWVTLYISSRDGELSLDLDSNQFSNRPNVEDQGQRWYPPTESENLQTFKEAMTQLIDHDRKPQWLISKHNKNLQGGHAATLQMMFAQRMTESQDAFQYQSSHFWWRALLALQNLARGDAGPHHVKQLIASITGESKDQTRKSREARFQVKHRLRHLQYLLEDLEAHVANISQEILQLRTKMWYVSDVKHSSPHEDALRIVQALQTMASTKGSSRPQGVTSWAKQRLKSSFGHQRAEAQVLEAMTASREHGGQSKLADEQVELTSRWLTKNSIENFCRGEERIHRFCFEVRKCGNKIIGTNIVDSPVLWSSKLFHREKLLLDRQRLRGLTSLPAVRTHHTDSAYGAFGLTRSAIHQTISQSNEFSAFRTPERRLNSWSFNKLNPNDGLDMPDSWQSRSLDSNHHLSRSEQYPAAVRSPVQGSNSDLSRFIDSLRSSLKTLLLSDLGYPLWSRGSETDLWIWSNFDDVTSSSPHVQPSPLTGIPDIPPGSTTLSDNLSDSTITVTPRAENLKPVTSNSPPQSNSAMRTEQDQRLSTDLSPSQASLYDAEAKEAAFPFTDMFKEMLHRISSASSPYKKLDLLYELEVLISQSCLQQPGLQDRDGLSSQQTRTKERHILLSSRLDVPRTQATSLEEVMANCSERRLGTLKTPHSSRIDVRGAFVSSSPTTPGSGVDEVVDVMSSLLRDSNARANTLFRDLQFIAAFVPPEILDHTPKGKAFWDASIAALAFKDEVCQSLIKQANEITNFHLADTRDVPQDDFRSLPLSLTNKSLTDAASLWTIVAKEGSPVAARELGLLYLTHPEVLPLVTSPLSKPKDVFKSTLLPQERDPLDTKGLDPLIFAVVYHWMELAANGGDKDAKDFLKGVGDLSTAK